MGGADHLILGDPHARLPPSHMKKKNNMQSNKVEKSQDGDDHHLSVASYRMILS